MTEEITETSVTCTVIEKKKFINQGHASLTLVEHQVEKLQQGSEISPTGV
jgi:hypothetical protein